MLFNAIFTRPSRQRLRKADAKVEIILNFTNSKIYYLALKMPFTNL